MSQPFFTRRARLISVSAIVLIFALIWFNFTAFFLDDSGPLQENTLVVIPSGSSINQVMQLLADTNVISHNAHEYKLLRIAYHLFFTGQSIKAGEYEFTKGITPRQVLQKIATGEIYYRRLTIPEGLTTSQIMQLVKDAPGLTGEVPTDILEGDLLPETYLYTSGDDRMDLVNRMYTKMDAALHSLWQGRQSDSPLRNPKEAVILASIVEKETNVGDERGIVASVYLNRLKKGMKLQADPTVIYAVTGGRISDPGGYTLTSKDLKRRLPHNTYVHAGLPPTPICNPGRASLEAVLMPPVTPYVFFVATGDGGHNFSETLEEHNRNVRLYKETLRKLKKR